MCSCSCSCIHRVCALSCSLHPHYYHHQTVYTTAHVATRQPYACGISEQALFEENISLLNFALEGRSEHSHFGKSKNYFFLIYAKKGEEKKKKKKCNGIVWKAIQRALVKILNVHFGKYRTAPILVFYFQK
ncbi:hypothetical protein POVWA2_020460 [Plasmodium ovale wallikeri]|uniref:Uncharacterized protein n=1 Tax=Plasmodium ovale wallikeri TaxID=864142 RepID=A0A1A8YR74_PLAOA|nr:hypothetical protein POVWA1_020280 [Plasmodium ovale wallikeri]SBT34557.1 hypothetical protein POVWA2_020460 [Plasmodium ovale wallikeri]